MKPAKGSALDIPTEPLTGFQCLLARVARLGPLCGWTQGVQNSRSGPHSGPKPIRPGIARIVTMAAAVVFGGSSSVFACPVCFGAEETSMIDGSKLGVLVLLVITLAVQGGFAGFFLYLRKRAKRIADMDLDTEWSQLQGGASRI
jgi:hypothetical protein